MTKKRLMIKIQIREEYGDYFHRFGWVDIDEGVKNLNDFYEKVK